MALKQATQSTGDVYDFEVNERQEMDSTGTPKLSQQLRRTSSLASRTNEPTDDNNNSVNSSGLEQAEAMTKEFSWLSYLRDTNSTTVDQSQFRCLSGIQENFLLLEGLKEHSKLVNPFQIGDCLEGIDPAHESLICPLKVVEISGYRIRLRFIGFNEKSDFWILSNTPFIFPCGWSENNGRFLQKFGSREGIKSWKEISRYPNLRIAPKENFAIPWDCPEEYNDGFDIGKKLEAVDRRNPYLTCVATIIDRIGNYILISFDGWNFAFDQWVHITSYLIQPVGYCLANKLVLSTPEGKPSIGFSWSEYLVKTNTQPVSEQAFEQVRRGTLRTWNVDSKLECVDIYFPFIIRPATILEHDKKNGILTLRYDGFPDYLDFCIDQDSFFLLPAGFSRATNDRLVHIKNLTKNNESPSVSVNRRRRPPCSEKFCLGFGNQNLLGVSYHTKPTDCPYSRENRCRNRFLYSFRVKKNNIHYPYPRQTNKKHSDIPSFPKMSSPVVTNHGEVYFNNSTPLQPGPSNRPVATDNISSEKRPDPPLLPFYQQQQNPFKRQRNNTADSYPNQSSADPQQRHPSEPSSIPRNHSHENTSVRMQLEDIKPFISTIPSQDSPDQTPAVEPPTRNIQINGRLNSNNHNDVNNESDNLSHASDASRNMVTTSNLQIPPSYSAPNRNHIPVDSNFLDRLMPKTIDHKPNPHIWSPQDVGDYIGSLPFCEEFVHLFIENEIDGAALMCLEKEDLMGMFKMKLGPAIKISTAINALRKELMS